MCCNKSSRCGRKGAIRRTYDAYVASLQGPPRSTAIAQTNAISQPTNAPPSYDTVVRNVQPKTKQQPSWFWKEKKMIEKDTSFEQFEAKVMKDAREYIEYQRVARQA